MICKYFFPFYKLPFHLIDCSFAEAFILMYSCLFLLSLLIHLVSSKKSLRNPVSRSVFLFFFFFKELLSYVLFRFYDFRSYDWVFNPFELIFVSGLRQGSNFFLLGWLSSFCIYWRDCSLPTEHSWLPCQILVDSLCEGLFLGSQFCATVFCVILMAVPYCFNYCSFVR